MARLVTVTYNQQKCSWELCKLQNITWDKFVYICMEIILMYTIDVKGKNFFVMFVLFIFGCSGAHTQMNGLRATHTV